MFSLPVQLTTSRIGNLTRLTFTLALRDDRTYIRVLRGGGGKEDYHTSLPGAGYIESILLCKIKSSVFIIVCTGNKHPNGLLSIVRLRLERDPEANSAKDGTTSLSTII